jgi:hypothetical protein
MNRQKRMALYAYLAHTLGQDNVALDMLAELEADHEDASVIAESVVKCFPMVEDPRSGIYHCFFCHGDSDQHACDCVYSGAVKWNDRDEVSEVHKSMYQTMLIMMVYALEKSRTSPLDDSGNCKYCHEHILDGGGHKKECDYWRSVQLKNKVYEIIEGLVAEYEGK